MVVAFIVVLVAAATAFYQMYIFYGVEGHADDEPPSLAIWFAMAIELLGAVGFAIAAWRLVRAGFFSWWPRHGLIGLWWERRKQKASQ